jgi:phospholipid/cholesterol/gamma-HCH transport system permease protein
MKIEKFSLKLLIASLGASITDFVEETGRAAILFGRLLVLLPACFSRFSLVIKQVAFLGNKSFVIVTVSSLFVGFVLALQGFYTLSRYGSEQALGVLVALSVIRELGPVVSALLYAGRAGTSLTAEIGLMRSGEQIDAMEVMGVDPLKRVLAPRLLGGVISLPILAILFSSLAVLGGWLVGVGLIGVDSGAFWSLMQSGVDFRADVMNGIVKSIVFAFAVNLTALFEGFYARPTPEGVSNATTRSVVRSSLAVLALDFVLTAFMFV